MRGFLSCTTLKGMMTANRVFVGVMYYRPGRQFHYAGLDEDCSLLALGKGSLQDCAAYLAGVEKAWVGAGLASHFSLGLVTQEEMRQRQAPLFPGRPAQMRMAEFELACRGIVTQHTPGGERPAPAWLKQGFAFYQEIGSLGYHEYPAPDAERVWLETSPEAVYHALLPAGIFPAGSLEGRLQRQLALCQAGLDLPDPMDFFEEITRHRLLRGVLPLEQVYAQPELDALASAYTCWLASRQPGKIALLGVPEEGRIGIPMKDENQGQPAFSAAG